MKLLIFQPIMPSGVLLDIRVLGALGWLSLHLNGAGVRAEQLFLAGVEKLGPGTSDDDLGVRRVPAEEVNLEHVTQADDVELQAAMALHAFEATHALLVSAARVNMESRIISARIVRGGSTPEDLQTVIRWRATGNDPFYVQILDLYFQVFSAFGHTRALPTCVEAYGTANPEGIQCFFYTLGACTALEMALAFPHVDAALDAAATAVRRGVRPGPAMAATLFDLLRAAELVNDRKIAVTMRLALRDGLEVPEDWADYAPLLGGLRTIGDFELVRKIGETTGGTRWLAQRLALAGPFRLTEAITFPKDSADDGVRAAFRHTSRLGTLLSNSNVVMMFDTGETDEALYVVTEWVDGLSAHALVQAERGRGRSGLDQELVAFVAGELLRGLAYAARLVVGEVAPTGIHHGALSSEHVHFSCVGEVKLGGFGWARAFEPDGSDEDDAVADLRAVAAIMRELCTEEPLDPRLEQFLEGLSAAGSSEGFATAEQALEALMRSPVYRYAGEELARAVRAHMEPIRRSPVA